MKRTKPFDSSAFAADTQPVLGIHFGDNDFHAAIRAFLSVLGGDEVWLERVMKGLTKADVVTVYNETIYGLYLMTQKLSYHDRQPLLNEKAHLTKYLSIKEENVFIGPEVLAHYNTLMASGNYNGDYHFLVGREVNTL
jgi:hypothetical protein